MPVRDGARGCSGCGLANYEGLCPVCRGDERGYMEELHFAFGDWYPGQDDRWHGRPTQQEQEDLAGQEEPG